MSFAIVLVVTLTSIACKDKGTGEAKSETDERAPVSSDAAVTGAPPIADTELAHLRAWSGEPSSMAIDAATGCDKGDAAACYRLGNLYEEGMGTEHDMARAHALHARACDGGRGEACRILGALLFYDSGPPADPVRANEYMARACELGFLDACHTVGNRMLAAEPPQLVDGVARLTRGCRRGYAPACRALESYRSVIEAAGVAFPSLETLPIDQLPVPSPEAACPPMHHMTTSTGGGARLNGGLAQVPHEQLLAALPEAIRGWKVTRRSSSPAGRAGTRVSYGGVELEAGDSHLTVSVTDHYMNCTLQPRIGEMALAATVQPGADKQRLEVAGHAALAVVTAEGSTLSMWLADRCSLYIGATPPVPVDDLVPIAAAVDLDALTALCARRETGL